MLTESELRDELQAGASIAASTIDPDAVIRRARRRRTPRQIAVGSVTALAVAGFTILGISTVPSLSSLSGSGADSAAVSDAEAPLSSAEGTLRGDEGNAKGTPESDARILERQCGEAVPHPLPNPWGLELVTSFPSQAPANGQPISGIATLTNTSTSRVQGSTAALPTALLSRDGITVWRTAGVTTAQATSVDLGPGNSMSYAIDIEPRTCSTDVAPELQFREGLPALSSGAIEVMVAIDFIPHDSGEGTSAIVSSPTETIDLR